MDKWDQLLTKVKTARDSAVKKKQEISAERWEHLLKEVEVGRVKAVLQAHKELATDHWNDLLAKVERSSELAAREKGEEYAARKRQKYLAGLKTTRELAASAIVASVAFEPPSTSNTQLTYSEVHLNIKREPYNSADNEKFKDLIQSTEEDNAKALYRVKDTKRGEFIATIQGEYEAANYVMHPYKRLLNELSKGL